MSHQDFILQIPDYIFNEEIGRCYKFHQTPKNWTDAYSVCSAEQSYLAVINTQAEADLLVRLTEIKTRDKVAGNYLSGAVHLGFHNRLNEGWQAVGGKHRFAFNCDADRSDKPGHNEHVSRDLRSYDP